MNNTSLPRDVVNSLEHFILDTANAWIHERLIKQNAFGVELIVSRDGFQSLEYATFGSDEYKEPGSEKDSSWYVANAGGKNKACLATGLDSREAVRLYQGVLAGVEGVFPWGGAVIDKAYGIIVGVSGFKEDEDILMARTIRNYLVMLLDREGQSDLDNARTRGEQEGDVGADRFTR